MRTNQQPLTESLGDLVSEIVHPATELDVRRRSLPLQPFRVAVEDLQRRSAGGLRRVAATEPAATALLPYRGCSYAGSLAGGHGRREDLARKARLGRSDGSIPVRSSGEGRENGTYAP